jgi:glutamine synthetase
MRSPPSASTSPRPQGTISNYFIFQITWEERLIRAICNTLDDSGIPVEFSNGEWGPGQSEINLRYAKAAWIGDNRTAGFRLVVSGAGMRIECRIPGADANPYIAFAATIAAGLHGIEDEAELEPMSEGNPYDMDVREIPKTLRGALEELGRSEVVRATLGDTVVDHYLHTGRREKLEYDGRVTEWEHKRSFEQA